MNNEDPQAPQGAIQEQAAVVATISAAIPAPVFTPTPISPQHSYLNQGQQAVFDAVLRGESIFLTGPGGTGKSFLIHHLYHDIYKQIGKKVSLTALTGCAALLLHPKAKTIHSWAGIRLGKDPVPILVRDIRKNRRAALRWVTSDILVIDEISMMTPELFEKLDQVGRQVRRNDRLPFGGLQLVLVGDFYQLPPVSKGDSITFLFESDLWKQMNLSRYELSEIVRQKDPVFQKILNQARRGEMTRKSLKILATRMDLDYQSLEIKPTMLFTRRAEVDDINMTHLAKLTTERKIYKPSTLFLPTANTQGLTEQDSLVQKAVAKLDADAAYSPELILAVGAQVMLIVNKDPGSGLVNGSRGIIVGFIEQTSTEEGVPTERRFAVDTNLLLPLVKFRSGITMAIEHATWEVPDMPGVLRRQIPLRLAWAYTVHKAQGSTLDCALIDVGEKTFEYGQAYVALSRVKDLESLYIHDLEPTAFRAHEKVKAFYSVEPVANPG